MRRAQAHLHRLLDLRCRRWLWQLLRAGRRGRLVHGANVDRARLRIPTHVGAERLGHDAQWDHRAPLDHLHRHVRSDAAVAGNERLRARLHDNALPLVIDHRLAPGGLPGEVRA